MNEPTILFDEQDMAVIAEGLKRLPWEQANPVIMKIIGQGKAEESKTSNEPPQNES